MPIRSRVIGLDSDGFDLRIGERLQRIEFDGFVADASAARERLRRWRAVNKKFLQILPS